MTIEIRELVIEARVTQTPTTHAVGLSSTSVPNMSRVEQERLIETITRRVLENLRDAQHTQGDWS